MNRIYRYWLHFLRFGHVIDAHSAQAVGNINELAWCRIRIADIDHRIDQLAIQSRMDAAVLCVCLISALPWEWL